MTERTFTLEEANAAIPDLTVSLTNIREARHVVFEHGEKIRAVAVRNGGGAEGSAYYEALRTLRREMERLTEDGVIVRDAESGLVDFPSEREGRIVYLCWRLGEDRVTHWHDPETGFAGRKPL